MPKICGEYEYLNNTPWLQATYTLGKQTWNNSTAWKVIQVGSFMNKMDFKSLSELIWNVEHNLIETILTDISILQRCVQLHLWHSTDFVSCICSLAFVFTGHVFWIPGQDGRNTSFFFLSLPLNSVCGSSCCIGWEQDEYLRPPDR